MNREATASARKADSLLADWRGRALALEGGVNRAVVGLEAPVRLVLIALFARGHVLLEGCLLYTSPSPRDGLLSRMPSSA